MSAARFVVDNSVVMAWGLDERDEYADAVMERLVRAEALVPGVWPLEFANALLVAERRGRIAEADAARLKDLVLGLPIRVVADTPARILSTVLAAARRHGLSVYDASYLDLAAREGVRIATSDRALREAARRSKVPLVA